MKKAATFKCRFLMKVLQIKRWMVLNTLDEVGTGRQFMRSLMINTSNNQMLSFQNTFYSNENKSSMFLIMFLFMSKRQFKKLVLSMGCFLIMLKLDRPFLEKQTRIQQRKIKHKNQYLNLKVSRYDQRSILYLKKNGLKLISRQEKKGSYHILFQRYIPGFKKK